MSEAEHPIAVQLSMCGIFFVQLLHNYPYVMKDRKQTTCSLVEEHFVLRHAGFNSFPAIGS